MTIYFSFGLLALGLALIVLEVFIPSLGMLGVMAAASIIGGGVLAYLDPSSSVFILYVAISFVLIPTMMVLALKYLPKTPIGKHFALGGPSFDKKEAQAIEKGIDDLVGCFGETITPLRPSGIALIEDRRVDVVTRGEMADKGVRVKVLKVEGNRIVVEECNENKS